MVKIIKSRKKGNFVSVTLEQEILTKNSKSLYTLAKRVVTKSIKVEVADLLFAKGRKVGTVLKGYSLFIKDSYIPNCKGAKLAQSKTRGVLYLANGYPFFHNVHLLPDNSPKAYDETFENVTMVKLSDAHCYTLHKETKKWLVENYRKELI